MKQMCSQVRSNVAQRGKIFAHTIGDSCFLLDIFPGITWKNHKVQNKIATSYHVSASIWDNTCFVLRLIQKPPKSTLKSKDHFTPVLTIASLQLTGGVLEQLLPAPQPRH